MTKEFVLKTLLKYKENPDLCAIENGSCRYLTADGRKCALGQYMLTGKHQAFDSGYVLLKHTYRLEEVFTKEFLKQRLTDCQVVLLQSYHDNLASEYYEDANEAVKKLEKEINSPLTQLYL